MTLWGLWVRGALAMPVDPAGFLVGLRELLQVKQTYGDPALVLYLLFETEGLSLPSVVPQSPLGALLWNGCLGREGSGEAGKETPKRSQGCRIFQAPGLDFSQDNSSS